VSGAPSLSDTLDQALAGTLPGLSMPAHLLGEALELSPATQGLRARYPGRVHLLPAADATLVGVGLGLAMSGAPAVVELADPTALWAALPQLAEASALHGAEAPLRLVIRVPCGPDRAPVPPEELLSGLPGLALAAAADHAELVPLLQAALAFGGPVVLLESRLALAGRGAETREALPLGRARLRRAGTDASALAFGEGVAAALAAADILAAEGISLEVFDLRCLRPLDSDAIAASVQATGRPVVVGAAGPALLAAVQHAFLRLESPPSWVAEPQVQAVVEAVRASVRY